VGLGRNYSVGLFSEAYWREMSSVGKWAENTPDCVLYRSWNRFQPRASIIGDYLLLHSFFFNPRFMDQTPENSPAQVSPPLQSANPKAPRPNMRVLVLLALVFGIGATAYSLLPIAHFNQITHKVKKIINPTDIPPEHLTYAPHFVHVEAGESVRNDFIVGNEGAKSGSTRFGIEMKSVRAVKDQNVNKWELFTAPNERGIVSARIVARGAVYDSETNGATASCFVFNLKPGWFAQIPFIVAAKGTHGPGALKPWAAGTGGRS